MARLLFPLIPCCGFRRWQFPRTKGTDRQLFSQNSACRSSDWFYQPTFSFDPVLLYQLSRSETNRKHGKAGKWSQAKQCLNIGFCDWSKYLHRQWKTEDRGQVCGYPFRGCDNHRQEIWLYASDHIQSTIQHKPEDTCWHLRNHKAPSYPYWKTHRSVLPPEQRTVIGNSGKDYGTFIHQDYPTLCETAWQDRVRGCATDWRKVMTMAFYATHLWHKVHT